jgi:hypothetical protein
LPNSAGHDNFHATMTTPAVTSPSKTTSTWFGLISAFALHTFLVYMLAMHISSILVGRWFAWVLPAAQLHISVSPRDWYLQHLELVTIVPALVAGYINVARFIPTIVGGQEREARREPAAIWAWVVPSLILAYRMVQYHPTTSVLSTSSMSALRYFFEIEREMPRFTNVLIGDPVRVLAQMSVTAPFYAGIAYSLGALSSENQVLKKLFAFDHSGATPTPSDDSSEPTPALPSSLPD